MHPTTLISDSASDHNVILATLPDHTRRDFLVIY